MLLYQRKAKSDRNSIASNDLFLFPLKIGCIGNISPVNVSAAVIVFALLSLAPFLSNVLQIFFFVVPFNVRK